MSDLINPRSGMPFAMPQAQRRITDEQLVQILTGLETKIHYLNQQNMHLSLFLEFVVENLQSIVDSEGNQLIHINMDEWQEFAQRRHQEVLQEIAQQEEALREQATQDIATHINEVREEMGIDLDE